MIPLAEELRPTSLDTYIGQSHLVGENGVLRTLIESGRIPSMILWGPPGIGKTTLATIISKTLNRPFYVLSAISSGVKDVRDVIDRAKQEEGSILFIDEIHRFNKSQQDSLLGAVERGTITLIGATTENPSFEVISALLSRCQVYILKEFGREEMEQLLVKAADHILASRGRKVTLQETEALLRISGGDARKAVSTVELLCLCGDVTLDTAKEVTQKSAVKYDKEGDSHYDLLSAFQKSIRGSDENAALHYLARLVAAGDLPAICRRLSVIAAEDIGLAYPSAITVTNACVETALRLGFPEARIPLAEAVILLATAPKSNSAICGIDAALERLNGDCGEIPMHLRDTHYSGAEKLDRGGYKYPHSFENSWVKQQYLPDKIKDDVYYTYGENKIEQATKAYWDKIKK